MNFFNNLNDKFNRFMSGRYGYDYFGIFLITVSLIFAILSRIYILRPLILCSYAGIAYSIFRILSKNISNRQKENRIYLNIWYKIKNFFLNLGKNNKDHKNYSYFKCPNCGRKMRAPKGIGLIQVTCSECKTIFKTKA